MRGKVFKADDKLPWRCLNEPLPDGPAKGNTVPLERMLKKTIMTNVDGIRTTGYQSRKRSRRLGLSDLVREHQ